MDPVEIARINAEARRDPGKWGLNQEALALPANQDVVIEGEGRKNTSRAQRFDVFSLMFFRANSRLAPGSYDAVRRLQKDLAILHQTQGTSDAIRTATSAAASFITEDFRINRTQAGQNISEVMEGMAVAFRDRIEAGGGKVYVSGGRPAPSYARLVRELAEHEVVTGSAPNWHAVVRSMTGEFDRHRQGEIVRQACDDLAASYRAIDNEPRRAVG